MRNSGSAKCAYVTTQQKLELKIASISSENAQKVVKMPQF